MLFFFGYPVELFRKRYVIRIDRAELFDHDLCLLKGIVGPDNFETTLVCLKRKAPYINIR